MAITAHDNWMWSAHPAGRPTYGVAGLRRTVRPRPFLEPQERILGESPLRDGGHAVGTDRALVIGSTDGQWRRLAWADIAEAAWSPATASTVLRLWSAGTDPPLRVELLTDRRFAALTADRVADAQVLRRRVQLTETVTATVLATRSPGLAELTWRVLLDAGRGEGDPRVAHAARRVVAELRGLAGC